MVNKLQTTKEEFTEALNESNSVKELCIKLNKTKPSVYTYASRFNIPLKGRWKTEDYVRNDGYFYYTNPKNHRRIFETHLGNKLDSSQSVHHLDGNKQNNDIFNLISMTKSEHQKAHKSLETIGFDLYREGSIEFDKETLTYKLKRVKG